MMKINDDDCQVLQRIVSCTLFFAKPFVCHILRITSKAFSALNWTSHLSRRVKPVVEHVRNIYMVAIFKSVSACIIL